MRLLAYCEGNHHSIIEYLSKRIDFVQGFALLLLCMHMWFLLFTRNSLVRANSEVYVLLYVCLFVLFCLFVRFLSTITRPAAARFTPNFACGRTLVPDVPSPLLGVSAPPGGKRGKWNFRYYRSQRGIFAFWWFLSDIYYYSCKFVTTHKSSITTSS